MVNETSINTQYKDRLFKLVFRDKRDLLQLYNAVNHTLYDNPEDIEVNTMEDVIYMGMRNDISFVIHSVLNLYEHQSTFSPNFPLRGLFYFADIYRKMVAKNGDLYSSRQIKLPFPQFIVFYNGTTNAPEEQTLYLHDAFNKCCNNKEFLPTDVAVDCRAIVLNINVGHNQELMKQCRKLEEYSIFVGKVREYNEQAHIDSEKQISMEEGENRVNQLNIILAEQGRTGDIIKAAQDKEYQRKLFEEFNL